jgi:hypothetical protein
LPHDSQLRLFLDECLSSDAVKSLRAFWSQEDYPNLSIDHLAEHYARGEGDDIWLPKLQAEPDWIVITQDHGRDPKKPKLPDICKALGRTHIIISETIQTNADIKHALTAVLRMMFWCPELPKGTQVRLNLQTLSKTGMKVPILSVEGKRIDIWLKEHGIGEASKPNIPKASN